MGFRDFERFKVSLYFFVFVVMHRGTTESKAIDFTNQLPIRIYLCALLAVINFAAPSQMLIQHYNGPV